MNPRAFAQSKPIPYSDPSGDHCPMSRMPCRLLPLLILLLLAPLACTAEQQQASSNADETATAGAGGDDAEPGQQTGAAEAAVAERIRARIREQQPNAEITSVRNTPVEGIYEVVATGQVFYVTADARYVFSGNLIDLREGRNITRTRQAELAHEVVADLERDRMVVFAPAGGQARKHITVFTDTTCGYCRRLHQEVLSLVEEYPVEVRYAMFPRAGKDSAAADTLRNVWCADDPASALTRAKEGQSIEQRDSGCDTPMDEHLAAANRIGVRGTPYMVLGDDGPVVPGYRPRRELVSMLGLQPRQ